MKWIKFSERWPEKQSAFFYYSAIGKTIGIGFMIGDDEAPVIFHRLIAWDATEVFPIFRSDTLKDYWMPLPDKPEVKHE